MLLGILSVIGALAPPPLTKSDRRAAKFREMLASVTLTDERLAMLDDAGLRTLLAGVQGASELPLVVDAFTIVYSDVAPVRLASRATRQLGRCMSTVFAGCEVGESRWPPLAEYSLRGRTVCV